MLDPISAFMAAQTAVAAIKKGISLGKDIAGIAGDLSSFAGAVSDLNFAYNKASDPPWYAVLFGSSGPDALDLFAKKKQAEALRSELKQYIQFAFGQSAWEELIAIEAQVRKERQANAYRKEELKQSIVEWSLGILVVVSGIGVLCAGLYFIGKKQGRW